MTRQKVETIERFIARSSELIHGSEIVVVLAVNEAEELTICTMGMSPSGENINHFLQCVQAHIKQQQLIELGDMGELN